MEDHQAAPFRSGLRGVTRWSGKTSEVPFATREEAKTARTDWIERHCNRRRPHSAVGYRHPAELMEEFEERAARAFADEVSLAA